VTAPASRIDRRPYGTLPDGRPVTEFRLDNGRGLVLTALDYGGIVTGLFAPDAAGRGENVVLELASLEDYRAARGSFLGALVGRYANRIANAAFVLDGQRHELAANQGANCLHGGPEGFGTRLWNATPMQDDDGDGVSLLLQRTSADGEMGFPGTLDARVRYSLGADMTWRIDYEARTDRATVVNLTSHAYFNLGGSRSGSALRHHLTLHASRYTEVDDTLIPLRHRGVEGTDLDFRTARVIGDDARHDHNWLLDHPHDGRLHPAVRLQDPASGRWMEMSTTEPCVQFYAGNHLAGTLQGRDGQRYERGAGLCLETQHAPDSPNHPADPDWPSTVLRPGEVYRSSTVHRFGAVPPSPARI
jgi:aldose 1-epimerase